MPVDVVPIVARHVEAFTERRRSKIAGLTLRALLIRKNPYMLIARQVEQPGDLAEAIVGAALSSSEETMFGHTLEAIAVDVCAEAYSGLKSAATGVDLEFTREARRYVVSIKSGPNWGNSSQIKKLREELRQAVSTIRQHDPSADVRAVNGCCYGADQPRDLGDYQKLCGAQFWELISGDSDLYRHLIPPIRDAASNGFTGQRAELLQRVSDELAASWTTPDGRLDWPSIVAASAG